MTRTTRWMAAGACVGLVLLGGCVTRGTYHDVLAERDRLAKEGNRLAERLQKAEASRESLEAERVRLLDELEDLRLEQSTLQTSVHKLRQTKESLGAQLRVREQELAAHSAELQRIQGTYESLVEDLEQEVATGQIQIEQLREGLRLNLSDRILFPSGSAELSEQGVAVLKKVAAQLHGIRHRVEVQGHTDGVPISGQLATRFPTNWELASARAARVVRLLEAEKIDPARLTAISFGANRPVAPNDTPEGRARNRRIEIRLIPVERAETAPGS